MSDFFIISTVFGILWHKIRKKVMPKCKGVGGEKREQGRREKTTEEKEK
jgi:hypothetical protein